MKLNKEQEEGSKKIIDFALNRNGPRIFTLSGPPGSGKTFMLKDTLSYIYTPDIMVGAISHAATQILKNQMNNRSYRVLTLASMLAMKYTETDGIIKFVPNRFAEMPIKTAGLLILDEVSMIDDTLYDLILANALKGTKIIAVGDPAQLPPIEQQHDSKFFDNITFNLSTIIRFGANLQELAQIYRKEIESINQGYMIDKWAINKATGRKTKVDSNGDGYIFEKSIKEMIHIAANAIKEHNTNKNFARILAYKNDTVNLVNHAVRQLIYGKNLPSYLPGETVISETTYGGVSKRLYNKQVLKVKSAVELMGPYGMPCYGLTFEEDAPFQNIVYTLRKDDEGNLPKEYLTLLYKFKSIAKRTNKWRNYFALQEAFAWFSYGYSMNLYKSQGGTFDNIYLLEDEVLGVKPLSEKHKLQALYVAVTRAKHKLHIFNSDYT